MSPGARYRGIRAVDRWEAGEATIPAGPPDTLRALEAVGLILTMTGCCALLLANAIPNQPVRPALEGACLLAVGPLLARWSRARRHRLRALPDGLILTHATGFERLRLTELAEIRAEGRDELVLHLRPSGKLRVRVLDAEGALLTLSERWGVRIER